MRQRNDTGYPLASPDVGRVIGPGEEFEFPLLITGCTDLEPPAEDKDGSEDGSGTPEDPGAPPAGQSRKTKAAGAAGEGKN